jgi:hypothetical protein
MMNSPKSPPELDAGGAELWSDISDAYELDASQRVQLLEACRAKDRLDRLDAVLRGRDQAFLTIDTMDDGSLEIVIDKALDKANSTANMMKQLLAAMRLPDARTGQRPQFRSARGVQNPRVEGGKPMSALEKARQARSA